MGVASGDRCTFQTDDDCKVGIVVEVLWWGTYARQTLVLLGYSVP